MASILDSLFAQERLQQGQDRLDMQADRYSDMAEQTALKNRFAAIQSALRMYRPGSPEQRGLSDELYGMATGGDVPGATYHNHLMEQGRYWDSVAQQNAARQQPQGLYRVGDEYGFNGVPMGRLSAGDKDAEFAALQRQHYGTMAQEQQSNLGSIAALQALEFRNKQSKEWMDSFKNAYGTDAGSVFSNYDEKTETANLPGGYVMERGLDGEMTPVQKPGRILKIPRAMFSTYRNHLATMGGFPSYQAMQSADPVNQRMARLRELEEKERAESPMPSPDEIRKQADLRGAYKSIFGEDPSEVEARTRASQEKSKVAAAKAMADKKAREREDWYAMGQNLRRAVGVMP